MKLGKAVVRSRVVILIIALALMVPSVIGMICTRVNYDMPVSIAQNRFRHQKTQRKQEKAAALL